MPRMTSSQRIVFEPQIPVIQPNRFSRVGHNCHKEEVRSRLFRTRDESIASPPNVCILPGGWGGLQERFLTFPKLKPLVPLKSTM